MKKALYPKTKRYNNNNIFITEKLDGSNLWLFKLWWELIIAQRNNVYRVSELNKNNSYKWLLWWIDDNKDDLDFCEWSWVFWEWIWIWKINYLDRIDKKFYIFAKANINEEYNISWLNYDRKLFQYPFSSWVIPKSVWIVPLVWNELCTHNTTNMNYLDELYDVYTNNIESKVEWFIIINNNDITKYIRYKDWIFTNHKK